MSYCRNCGSELPENATVCPRCGTMCGNGTAFCPHCGKPVAPGDVFCNECGEKLPEQKNNYGVGPEAKVAEKSKLTAGLLGIFLGAFGVHNFYLGYTSKAVIQLVITLITCCMCSPVSAIWGLVEGILILCGNISVDGQGNPLCE